jgi:hypothetical protein
VADVGQDQLAAAERYESKSFSDSLFVPDFFGVESSRVELRQALGELSNQRGLPDSR